MQEAEVAVSQDGATAVQPRQKEQDSVSKKKKRKRKGNLIPSVEKLSTWGPRSQRKCQSWNSLTEKENGDEARCGGSRL